MPSCHADSSTAFEKRRRRNAPLQSDYSVSGGVSALCFGLENMASSTMNGKKTNSMATSSTERNEWLARSVPDQKWLMTGTIPTTGFAMPRAMRLAVLVTPRNRKFPRLGGFRFLRIGRRGMLPECQTVLPYGSVNQMTERSAFICDNDARNSKLTGFDDEWNRSDQTRRRQRSTLASTSRSVGTAFHSDFQISARG